MKRITWGHMGARHFTDTLAQNGEQGTVYYLAFGNLVIAWRKKS